MKALLITSDFSPRLGGVARHYAALQHALGAELEVLTSVAGPQQLGVIRRSLSWSGWPSWLPCLWLVPYCKLKQQANLLIAGEVLPTGIALWLIGITFGWPYAVFVHGLDVQLAQSTARRRWLTRHILGRAQLVIVNSQFTRGLAVTAGAAEEHTIVVYPSLSLPEHSPKLAAELKQRHVLAGRRVLLTTCRLVARKGVARVLEVLPELARAVKELTYVVVGEGPERNDLEYISQTMGLPVIFVGAVSDAELSAWYSLADVFVLTPVEDKVDVEGFGIVYLEAQAAGKPVVGSAVGGVPEAVGQGGLVIHSQAELASALIRLFTTPELARSLGELGRARVAHEFTPERQAAILRKQLYAN